MILLYLLVEFRFRLPALRCVSFGCCVRSWFAGEISDSRLAPFLSGPVHVLVWFRRADDDAKASVNSGWMRLRTTIAHSSRDIHCVILWGTHPLNSWFHFIWLVEFRFRLSVPRCVSFGCCVRWLCRWDLRFEARSFSFWFSSCVLFSWFWCLRADDDAKASVNSGWMRLRTTSVRGSGDIHCVILWGTHPSILVSFPASFSRPIRDARLASLDLNWSPTDLQNAGLFSDLFCFA